MIVYIATKNIYYSSGIEILGVFKQFQDALDMANECDGGSNETTDVVEYELIE